MKHKTIEQLIQKSLDFEINTEESRLLHDHLATCPECRQLYSAMQQVRDSLGMLNEVYPSIEFNARIMQALGMTTRRVWKKAALVLGSIWVVSLASLFFVPYRLMVTKLLTSMPALVRLVDKVRVAATTIGHVLSPLAKLPINPAYPVIGIAVSIIMFLIIATAVHKEEKCKA
jgi:predicted anti-sigma-YlaC factor YlaD